MLSKRLLIQSLTVMSLLLTLAAKPTSQPSSQPVVGATQVDPPPRIVYVMDFSGSMGKKGVSTRAFVDGEIAKLAPADQFNLVLANGNGSVIFKRVMTPATDAAKTAAADFLERADFAGTDDLLNALRIAKKLNSDISIITDGDVGSPKAIAEFLKSIPAERQVRLELFDPAKVSDELVKALTLPPDHRAVQITYHPLKD